MSRYMLAKDDADMACIIRFPDAAPHYPYRQVMLPTE